MDNLAVALLALVAFIVVFLIFRAIVLWYWRINEAIELLRGINDKLERLLAQKPAR